MKKLLLISFIFLIGCKGPEIIAPQVVLFDTIFSVTESSVINGLPISFKLPKDGVYTLTLIDKETNQVISRERFTGTIGLNKKKIYTKSIQSRYLYLLLEDVTKTELGKTTLIIN
jgi:hypothetical protein